MDTVILSFCYYTYYNFFLVALLTFGYLTGLAAQLISEHFLLSIRCLYVAWILLYFFWLLYWNVIGKGKV